MFRRPVLLFKRLLSVLLSGSILNQFLFPAPRSSYTWDSFPVSADDEHPVKVSSDYDVHAYKASERPAVTVAEHGMQQGELVCVVGREGNIVPCTLMPGAKIGIQTSDLVAASALDASRLYYMSPASSILELDEDNR
jgi:hypothetical protein